MKADEKSGLYDEPKVKLYTEEQVNYAIYLALNEFLIKKSSHEKILDSLTLIELPTDEEIEEASPIINRYSFIQGAKWMRNQLKEIVK